MSDSAYTGRRFSFSVRIDINPHFGFTYAELMELLSDGLFAMDEAGLLFPGVSIPGDGQRLFGVRVGPLDQLASLRPPKADVSYEALLKRRRVSAADETLGSELYDAAMAIGIGLLRQRMLKARMMALNETATTGSRTQPLAAMRDDSKVALAAARRLIEVTQEVLDPILGPYPPP
jgi:hypothetical protein